MASFVLVVCTVVVALGRESTSIVPSEERSTPPPHPGMARHAADFIDECECGAAKGIWHPHVVVVVVLGGVLKDKVCLYYDIPISASK